MNFDEYEDEGIDFGCISFKLFNSIPYTIVFINISFDDDV